MTEPAAETAAPPRHWTRWPKRIAAALLGIVVGLGVAEMAFRYRDDGAFPHLNTYVEDPELGVRLEPGATEKISFGGNPVTSVRINEQGYRGEDWPAAGKDDVLVVGDSQVFGLGVEEDETFSAVLGDKLHRAVLNGGVPTYGPGEYAAVVKEQLAARHPKTVVLTLNMVNDLFEVSHPNKDRHRVWDGWAVRKETAPDGVTSFPGRHWLYNQSHLVFAFRKWWASGDPVDVQVKSEGTYSDLVAAGDTVAKQQKEIAEKTASGATKRVAAQSHLERDKRQIESAMYEALRDEEDNYHNYELMQITAQNAQPGDIIGNEFAEGARPIEVTADLIERGEQLRARLKKRLAARVAKGDAALAEVMTDRDNTLAHLTDLETKELEAAVEPPLLPYVRDVKQMVEADGARLVVVILPIDVQVSDAEWAKYGTDKRDMSRARLLSAELASSIERLGVSALDAQDVLKTVEPGAFLDHDIHMTPKGHAAVAGALAAKIEAGPPMKPVVSTRPAVPMPASWDAVNEIIVKGSTAAGCETKVVRDWLRVMCQRPRRHRTDEDVAFEEYGSMPLLTIASDDTGDAIATNLPYTSSFLVPLVPGKAFTGHLRWDTSSRDLTVTWPDGAGGKPKIALTAVVKEKEGPYRQDFRTDDERILCECWAHEFEESSSAYSGAYRDQRCEKGYGAADHGCVDRYYKPSDLDASCPRVIACAWRDPGSPAK